MNSSLLLVEQLSSSKVLLCIGSGEPSRSPAARTGEHSAPWRKHLPPGSALRAEVVRDVRSPVRTNRVNVETGRVFSVPFMETRRCCRPTSEGVCGRRVAQEGRAGGSAGNRKVACSIPRLLRPGCRGVPERDSPSPCLRPDELAVAWRGLTLRSVCVCSMNG